MLNKSTGHILVIDDNPAIHEDFKKIFSTINSGDSTLSKIESALFGETDEVANERTPLPSFQIDSALQGLDGVAQVSAARQANEPYSVAFIDIRMPPGIDGIATTLRVWHEDPDVQVVICTAYSDYTWRQVLTALGRSDRSDRLVILKKPFDNIEVLQLANALTEKWRLTQSSRQRSDSLGKSAEQYAATLATIGEHAESATKTAESLLAMIKDPQQRQHAQALLDKMHLVSQLIAQRH